jgi:hypothetical protein
MRMPVMNVGIVRMRVLQTLVAVRMGMRFAGRVLGLVFMPMMFVVKVAMVVLDGFMQMSVFMMLGEVQYKPGRHKKTASDELNAQFLPPKDDTQCRPDKRGRRKIISCPSSTQNS